MGQAASASQMGRSETGWLARPVNLAALFKNLAGKNDDVALERKSAD
jgi:hypothetical protein